MSNYPQGDEVLVQKTAEFLCNLAQGRPGLLTMKVLIYGFILYLFIFFFQLL